MKITDLQVQLVQSDCGRKWTHVYVHTDAGITGVGEATYSHKERVVRAMLLDLKEQFGITDDPRRKMENADLCINTDFGRGFCATDGDCSLRKPDAPMRPPEPIRPAPAATNDDEMERVVQEITDRIMTALG